MPSVIISNDKRDIMMFNCRLDPQVGLALKVYAAMQQQFIYEILEDFIRDGLEARGTSVSALLAIADRYIRRDRHDHTP